MITHSKKKQPTDGFLKPTTDVPANSFLPRNLTKAPLTSYSYGNIPLFSSKHLIQAKLFVNTPGDKYEREADMMADKVSGNINAKTQQSTNITPVIPSNGLAVTASTALSDKISSSLGGGKNMDGDTQKSMSQQFRTDFRNVKIHTDEVAEQMNDSLSAKAFTVGKDIYFNKGQYNPTCREGKHLLAHELTHTQQQSGGKGAASATIMRTPSDDAKALAKKLHDAMSGFGADEKVILDGLATLNRDQTKASLLKVEYKTAYGSELEVDLNWELVGDDLSRALFLLNGPLAETTMVNEATVVNAGTEDHKAKVGVGEVSVHTGVDYKPPAGGTTRTGGFSIGYTGTDTSESRFIQTIWSEVVSTQPDKSETMVNETGLGASNGTMDLTTDVTKPKYKIDLASATLPFYESKGRNVRTATGNTNYDRPGEFTDVILRQFDAGATKVVERDHFDGFLIKENKVVYQVSVVVEWVYTSKTAVTKSTKFGSGAAITTLPADVRKQLLVEYPKFDYIQ